MNAVYTEMQIAPELKQRLKSTWMAGDYDRFSRYMEPGAHQFFLSLPIPRGSRLLDVGCGSGQLALIAARAGMQVTGCDIAANWLDKARLRVALEGLDITFDEADAEALPYTDSEFDAVVSLIGAMFAPQPEKVAAELTRVCRSGGMVAMANWTPTGFIGQMFRLIAGHTGPSGMPSPVLWGDRETVRGRLSEGLADMKLTPRMYPFQYPFGPEAVVEFFRMNYGPVWRAFASLTEAGQEELRRELVDLWSTHNLANGECTMVDAEYLEVVATRG
jgi:SAM-dependent methyltransferase